MAAASRRAQPWPATDGGDDACRARARARAGAGSWRKLACRACVRAARSHGGVSMTPQPRPAGSTSSPAARENKEARVAVSGGVWRRAGVGLVMSPRGPKVLYGERFLYQKWCEWLTPRELKSQNFYCTNALLGSSGIFLPYNFLSLSLPFGRNPWPKSDGFMRK